MINNNNNNNGDGVAIVWYQRSMGTHASVTVDDKCYGFFSCSPSTERSSLQKAISELSIDKSELDHRESNSVQSITVQFLNVTTEQKREIQELCNSSFYACTTCMHFVSRLVKKTIDLDIPWPINQFPELSKKYLSALEDPRLEPQVTYGKPLSPLRSKILEAVERLGFSYMGAVAVALVANTCLQVPKGYAFLLVGTVTFAYLITKTIRAANSQTANHLEAASSK